MTTEQTPQTPAASTSPTETPATTPAPAADAAKPAEATPPTDAAKPADKKDEGSLLFKKPEDKPADADKKEGEQSDDKDKTEPEAIKFEDFKIDPEMVVDDGIKGELMGIVNNKELDDKGRVQALLDLHQKVVKDQGAAFEKFREGLREQTKNHPVLGGKNLEATIKAADNAVLNIAKNPKFGGSEDLYNGFVERLTMLGMGDDPYVIGFLKNVNTLLDKTKDDTIDAGAAGGTALKPVEDILYGSKKS